MNARVERWFRGAGWTPFEYQHRAWSAYRRGRDGLIHAPTGTGKTLAAWLGPVMEFLDERPRAGRKAGRPRRAGAEPLRVLWLTPMRALAGDTARSLREPVEALGMPWSIELRTGDTTASLRLKQKERLPTALVTTPESLSVLLSHPGAPERFSTLRCVVVDEWHELLGTKRGVLTELLLARLRSIVPGVRVWGVSATIGNLNEAASVLCPGVAHGGSGPDIIHAELPKRIDVHTIIPSDMERFPWAGHLGLRLADRVVSALEGAGSALLFTNTRSQAELWFRELTRKRPDWIGSIALHHGSLDRALREKVEGRLKSGELRCVVCTSSLDLGVDFSPVEQVIQVGSPKGVARLMQRAGRSGHRPGVPSTVLCVPAHAFELVEFAAARGAVEARDIESRPPIRLALDVLAQHVVSTACAGPFHPNELLREVRSTHAYAHITSTEWGWVMDFVTRGGAALRAYPRFSRVATDGDGRCSIASDQLAREHRLNIGVISSDLNLTVKVRGGASLGTIEESFVARLAPGDRFVFAGHVLELVHVRGNVASVRRSANRSGIVPRWSGGQMSLSSQLAERVRSLLSRSGEGGPGGHAPTLSTEVIAARPLLGLQAAWSRVPRDDELLIEFTRTAQGHHVYLFPFAGRSVHEGLGAILARRLTRRSPRSVLVAMNDYGVELTSPTAFDIDEALWRSLLSDESLLGDMIESVNTSEMTRRSFRAVARIAGLIPQGYPSRRTGPSGTARQLRASSDLFYDVFAEFDPANLLLEQARREVLENQLRIDELRRTLRRLGGCRLVLVSTARLTPMAFPLWAESLRTQQVSTERWGEMVRRMVLTLERHADRPATRGRPATTRVRPAGRNRAGGGASIATGILPAPTTPASPTPRAEVHRSRACPSV